MTQTVKGVRAALFTACGTLYSASVDGRGGKVLVTYGRPGNYQADYIVAVGMANRQPITRPTMGTSRSREKEAQIDVVISVYVPGTEVAQQTASEACDDLTELLDAYFRTSPNETLGGSCREAWVSNIDGPAPDVAYGKDGRSITGRIAESVVTVTARIRY